MNSSNLNISVEFNLSASPDTFNFTDTTNYSGITASNKLGNLKVTSPAGNVIHNNTSYVSPDIDYNGSPTSADFALTTIANGTWTFLYTVKLVDELQSISILSNDSAAKTFVIEGNKVSMIEDATATAFECVDTVTTPLTIVSATYSSSTGNTTVTIGETLGLLTPLALFQFTVDTIVSKTFSQAYTYVQPDVCLNWEQEECCSEFTITDVTTYPDDAVVTRLHTVHYPDGMVTPIADIESPLQELTISPIWTGTWTDTFTADFTTDNGIITITDSIRGVKEFKVTSDTYSCQIYSCYKNIVNKYADQIRTAPAQAIKTASWLTLASGVLNAYNLAKKCGKTDATDFLEQITAIAKECQCSCDCDDCADGTPTQVVGCCGNVGGSDFTIVIESLDGSITVSSNTVGSTTTFNIEVDGTAMTTFINNLLAVTSIDALSDVDTSSVAPVTGQALVWSGTEWVPGNVAQYLVDLVDVNDAGLADQMVLYYDFGSLSFKFKLISFSIQGASDVVFTGLANKDIIQWNGSEFVNVDNFLSLLSDVNTTGIVDDSALKWDTGTSKWIIYQPKTTLASLDDCVITTPADNDSLRYITGSGWVNLPRPTFTSVSGADFSAAFDNSGSPGQYLVALKYDAQSGEMTMRGVANNTGGAVVAITTIFTISTVGYRPAGTIPFLCTVGITGSPTVGGGSILSSGVVQIEWHMDATTGARTVGYPAGDIDLGSVPHWYVA